MSLLLFTLAGTTLALREHCPLSDFCISLPEGEITAEAGLCVVIPCSFTTNYWFKSRDLVCTERYTNIQSEFRGRVSLLEPDVRQKTCSFIINDLKESDSGSYQFRVNGELNRRKDGFTYPSRATVSVKGKKSYNTYTKEPALTGNTTVEKGDTLNLTCRAESFPPALITWTKLRSSTSLANGVELQSNNGSATLIIPDVTAEDSAQYICTVQHLNTTKKKQTEVTFKMLPTDVREPALTGNTTVEKGDTLNLTCRAESFPPALITWTKLRSSTSLANGVELQSNNGSTPLIISEPMFMFYSIRFSKILNSGCELQSELLTCVCISEGSPLPSITWPLLKNHNEHSVITSVSNYTINSTMSLRVKGPSNISVECISSNLNGEAKEILTTSPKKTGIFTIYHTAATDHSFMVFLIPLLLDLYLENHFVNISDIGLQQMPNESYHFCCTWQIYAGQEVEDDQIQYEAGVEGGIVAAEKTAPELDTGLKDVEYASIDFSLLKRQKPSQAAVKQETTETEYAEIKKEQQEEKGDKLREEGKMMEGEEEEAMIEQAKDTKRCDPEEEEGEDTAVYSNVKDIMSQV
uniref:Ig-like domain-containing protein n=1 Tax=Echeneis naucrates TaxID=173247 RepID=A0A665UWQ4_ECHNA